MVTEALELWFEDVPVPEHINRPVVTTVDYICRRKPSATRSDGTNGAGISAAEFRKLLHE